MLPSLSGGLRLSLVLALSVSYVAWHGHAHSAFAKGGGGDDGGDDGDDGDDGGDAGAKGGGDEDDTGEEEDPKDQPPVTSGGLFTLATYPVSELDRPLTMTGGITQVRIGVGTDISDKGAFQSAGLSVEGLYGATDNFTVRGGLTSAYNFKQYGVYAGFQGSLAYNLVDFRAGLRLNRAAVPEFANFCSPTVAGDPTNPPDATTCMHKDMTGMPDATLIKLPDGNYSGGPTEFALDLGFPFRYVAKPEIAIVALDTLMAINFTRKPDLLPSIGIATNPVPALSVVIFAQLQIYNFDTSGGNFRVPATARVEFSPTGKFDLGLEFILLNVKPPDPQKFYDSRFINLFIQARM